MTLTISMPAEFCHLGTMKDHHSTANGLNSMLMQLLITAVWEQ